MSALLEIQDLSLEFRTSRGTLHALNGISFTVARGEIFGLVGETGCGKTVTGLATLRLLPRTAHITRGKILFEGRDLVNLADKEMRELRGRKIAMIFQDPSASLNPVFTIGAQIDKVITQHLHLNADKAHARMLEMLDAVGLPDAKRIAQSYPHQLSGGMQQRAMIALALACQPSLLIADEPTTALDVTIQAQILELLRRLQRELGIALVLITHNLGVVAETCERLAVLYAGRVAEIGATRAIFEMPHHPYTRGLLAALPQPELRGKPLAAIPGTVPADLSGLTGCAFAPRCAHAFARCRVETPPLHALDDAQASACFLENYD